MQDSPPGITAVPHDDNIRHFDVTIEGPNQSPYESKPLVKLLIIEY
jgi:ubiquitin-conjugating enzyme E2 N